MDQEKTKKKQEISKLATRLVEKVREIAKQSYKTKEPERRN
jgi:hypothetical protein